MRRRIEMPSVRLPRISRSNAAQVLRPPIRAMTAPNRAISRNSDKRKIDDPGMLCSPWPIVGRQILLNGIHGIADTVEALRYFEAAYADMVGQSRTLLQMPRREIADQGWAAEACDVRKLDDRR